jgi:hypothetical protein
MSKGIRKSRRSIQRTTVMNLSPRYRIYGLYVLASSSDCVVAKSYEEARDYLSLTLLNKHFNELPSTDRGNISSFASNMIPYKPEEVVSFYASQIPNWEPESEDEENDPPRYNLTAKEIVQRFGPGVVYTEM